MNLNRQAFDTTNSEQRLSEFLTPIVRFLLLLSGLLTVGLLGVFILSQFGLIGSPAWQVLAGGFAAGLVSLSQVLVLRLTRRNRGLWAFALFAGILVAWSLVNPLLWETAWLIALLLAWIAPFLGSAAGLRRPQIAAAAVLSAAASALVLWINAAPPLPRLPSGNAASIAALSLLGSTVILFVLGTAVVHLVRYRSLQSRLVISFVLIITVPIVVTAAVSAITAFTNSQDQFGDSLEAVSSLKQGQIDSVMHAIALELAPLQQGTSQATTIQHILDRADQSDETYRLNLSVASTLVRNVIDQNPASHYDEVLILDRDGKVILSTYKLNEGANYSNESFFAPASDKFFATITRYPGKQNSLGGYMLVAAAPVYAAGGKEVRGMVVAVAKSDVILANLGPILGLSNAVTYLVGPDLKLITDPGGSYAPVNASPIVRMVSSKRPEGSSTYTSPLGRSVLGYAAWDSDINAALIAEIPRTEVLSKSLPTLFVSTLIGLFSIVIAVIAALSTSQAISDPITKLAVAANSLATGDLAARAVSDQRDEVGNLAKSFNSMAAQLQGVIGNLEQRVTERTEALEQQSLRLRTAAEVARDAAYAPNLDELLEQAARLIQDRFGFYHAGIFLLDEKKEFAVLRASPSSAGRQMLENGHRLRIGEQGIVGRVAATGEPRIALDTGIDAAYFSNPLLPGTHSEMALPLKTSDGVIGIIDIQSEQPEAFTQDDIAIVQIMADQLATAIQRTRLLEQVRTQLSQLERTQQGFTQDSWRSFEKVGRPIIGYKFDNIRLEAIQAMPEGPTSQGFSGGVLPAADDGQAGETVEIPVRLRGEIIGHVRLRFQSHQAPDVTMGIVQQIADRLATSLENARLLEDSIRRANKERAIGEITTKISASVNMRNVLQTAVEELGRAIPGSEVLVQLGPEAEL